MNRQQIIMNFSVPPSIEDLGVIAGEVLGSLPEEFSEIIEDLTVQIEDLPDAAIEMEMELESPYDLLALFRSGNHLAPGVEKKVTKDDDTLIIYRRPLLDMWCETGEDLSALLRQVVIEELGQSFDFSEDDIEEMTRRHYQGML